MIEFGIKDFIDILLVACLLYYLYKLMKMSGSINVFTGILVFILLWLVVSQVLEMKLLGSIFDKLVNVGVLALIIIFQKEIRRFLFTLGSHNHANALVRFFTRGGKKSAIEHDDMVPIVMACMNMAKQKWHKCLVCRPVLFSMKQTILMASYLLTICPRLNAKCW